MATVYERDLMPALSREMGDTDSTNYIYSVDQLFSAINDGYAELNSRGYKQQFSVVGSGATAYFSPDPSLDEQRILVLCSALILTEGEIQKSARNAIIHSNIAGRTDLSIIPQHLMQIRDKLNERINDFIDRENRASNSIDTEGQTVVQGEELKSSATITASNYAEGLVRVEISTGI